MIPAPFDYEVAESVGHALSMLGEREDAKLLAGGHSLLPLLRLRVTRPSLLVDIGRLEELSYIRDAGDSIAIGALTRHHDLATSALIQEHNPLLSYAAGLIGDPQVRHRGTIGGSLAHGDPASDLPAILLALDGEVDVAGGTGVRSVAAADFFHGVFETAAGAEEIVTEVRVPKLTAQHVWSYLKFRRRAQDWATVGVAALARRSNGGLTDTAIALVNMGATPLRARAAEAAWTAGETDPGTAADKETEPPSDTNGSAEYRRHLARVLVQRAVEEAIRR
jgi:aerobic carbon-monoxide dehydrogenase medium subunit